MKTIINICSALAICVTLQACVFSGSGPSGDSPEQMIAAARAVDDKFVEAYNNGDVDAVMETYWNNPGVVLYDPGALEIRGWDAIKMSMAETFSSMPGGRMEFTEKNEMVAGDMVIGWGRWRWTGEMPDGSSMSMDGRYTDVKAKRDGKWVYIIDHASAPLPPPPSEM